MIKTHAIIFTILLLLASVTSALSNQYLVELDEANINASTEFIHIFKKAFHVQRVISHRFLQTVSIEMKDNHAITSIHKHPSVKSVSPIQYIARADANPESHILSPEQVPLISPHRLTQVDKVHQHLKLKGQGIFIGVIDSGVDYYHPALGGGFGPGYKVAAGYDLVGDDWNSNNSTSEPVPDNDPLDNCGKETEATGHGTHVSGIIAGYDEARNFTGVAPGAKLGMWRVFGCQGSTRNDIVLSAMLMAFDEGVDIICMSLGSSIPWSIPNNIQAKVISKIVASGVSVVNSAGNVGKRGAFTTSTPGNVLSAFQVASANNEYMLSEQYFTVTGVNDPIRFNHILNHELTMPDGYLSLSYDGKGKPKSDACQPEQIPSTIKGSIALVKRGGCSYATKIAHLASKGAIGAILYNDEKKPLIDIVIEKSPIPVYTISLKNGLLLSNLLGSKARVFLKYSSTLLKNRLAGMISDFSSIGPTTELNFKPNIAAVGQLIYSTLPRNLGSWGIRHGTSMACPYVAGSIALYLQYLGKNTTSRAKVHEKFQNFALPTNTNDNKHLDSPLIQGAGLIQVYDTIMETTHLSPSQISFNDTLSLNYSVQNITITNHGLKSIKYRISNNVSVSLSPYDRSTFQYAYSGQALKTFHHAKIKFSTEKIELIPGESQTIQIIVNPPNTNPSDHVMYGGFIQFRSSETQIKDIHVPYFGVVGTQRDLTILDKSHFSIQNKATNFTYDAKQPIVYDTTSSLLIHFKLYVPTLVLKGELVNAQDRNILGYAFPPLAYLQRDFMNDTNPSSPVAWSGQYFKTLPYDLLAYVRDSQPTIPSDLYRTAVPGTYNIKISALKQFGNMKNELDWESFFLGPIIIN